MSLEERTGIRDLAYSQWHRPSRISRYITQTQAAALTYIDIDGAEVCEQCGHVLALIETAFGLHQRNKATTILRQLANQAGCKAYVVLYAKDETGDCSRFAARLVAPVQEAWRELSPVDWARQLVEIHEGCANCERRAAVEARLLADFDRRRAA